MTGGHGAAFQSWLAVVLTLAFPLLLLLCLGRQALQDAWKVFAVVMTIVVLILIIVAIVIAKKINIAIALIEQASKVMLRLPGLIILPFVTVLVIIAFSGWMVFLLLMITSLEDFTVDTVLQTFEFEQYFDCNGTDTTNVVSHVALAVVMW